jgi:hypothetical protein
MARFFGAWFGVFPFTLCQVNLNVCATPSEDQTKDKLVPIPPFKLSDEAYDAANESAKIAQIAAIEIYNSTIEEGRNVNFTLESGAGSSLMGGRCSNKTDFKGMLMSCFQELVPDCVSLLRRCRHAERNHWLEEHLGVTSTHRLIRKHPNKRPFQDNGFSEYVEVSNGFFSRFLSKRRGPRSATANRK